MKNTLKKVVAFVLAMAMVVALSACGETEEKSTVIKVGATGPLTGGAASYGNSVKNGAEIAIAEVNAAGGINGIMLEFTMLDDEADSEKAASGYDTLQSSGMQISIGSVTSGSCEAFAKRAKEDNLLLMTPSASAASVIETGDHAFRVCFGDPQQGTLAADELTKTYTKIGCIYDTSDTYSSGIYEAFEARMKELGVSYEVRTFDQDNATDFSAQVEGLKDCEVIFCPFYYTEAGLVARTCVAKGFTNIAIFGADGLDGVAKEIDETVTNKVSYITPFDVNSTDEKVAKFVAAYKEKTGSEPDQFAADGYDAIWALANAMIQAGVNDASITASELCEKVKAVLTDASFTYEGVTGTMQWEASGSCQKTPVIVEVK